MKSLAWQYVWWPKIDSDIKAKVRGCGMCAAAAPDPPPSLTSMGVASKAVIESSCRLRRSILGTV